MDFMHASFEAEKGKASKFLLIGVDSYLMSRFLEELRKKFPQHRVLHHDTEQDLFDSCSSSSLFSEEKNIHVFEGVTAESAPTCLECVEITPRGDLLILSAPRDIGKNKAFSQIKAISYLVEMEEIKDWDFEVWLGKRFRADGFRLNDETLAVAASRIGNDMFRVDKELRKLELAFPDKRISLDNVLSTVSDPSQSGHFRAVDSYLSGDLRSALDYIRTVEESELIGFIRVALSELDKCLRVSSLLEAGTPTDQIANLSGVNPFMLRSRYLGRAQALGSARIAFMISGMCELELSLKTRPHPKTSMAEYSLMRCARRTA